MSRRSSIDDIAADWITRRDVGLSAAEEREFAQWLEGDPRHAAALARHNQTWSALEQPRRAGRDGQFLQQLAARATRRNRRRLRAAGAALTLLVAAGAIWHTYAPGHLSGSAAAHSTGNALLILPETQTLPDGSVVELNTGARIMPAFDAAARLVRLRDGQAHFQVKADVARPFIVEAAGVQVRAVGTAFSVEVRGKVVDVVVTEGTVTVAPPATAASAAAAVARGTAAPTTVEAGHKVAVELDPTPTGAALAPDQLTIAEMDARLAWRAPRVEFSNTPLAEAVALLNRHSGGRSRLVVDESEVRDVHISGYFRADNAETFVRLLEASFGVRAEHTRDRIILRREP